MQICLCDPVSMQHRACSMKYTVVSLYRPESPNARLERVLREADEHIKRTRESRRQSARPGHATQADAPSTDYQVRAACLHHEAAASGMHPCSDSTPRPPASSALQPGWQASDNRQLTRQPSAIDLPSGVPATVRCADAVSSREHRSGARPAPHHVDNTEGQLTRPHGSWGLQTGRLIGGHKGAASIAQWMPRSQLPGQCSSTYATPPHKVDERELQQARIAYREEVAHMMQKKRGEMAGQGYLL
jgi:hypothetical protein